MGGHYEKISHKKLALNLSVLDQVLATKTLIFLILVLIYIDKK
jgi:hypothetical protein